MDTYRQLEANHNRRMACEDRFVARMEKREAVAEKQIGELSSGKCYVYPVGGKYRGDLIAFLIRNNYA